MNDRCPICSGGLAREQVNSTRFEDATSIGRCEACGFEVPLRAALRGTRSMTCDTLQRDGAGVREAVNQLRELSLTTRTACPYCDHALVFLLQPEHLECSACGYQEHLARHSVCEHLID